MEDTIKIRKDKVKNVAIVFLSVMLVLTFFSNSILNRALPEVATAYVEYNTITEKVRGTGVVTADDPYKVVVKDSRTIESVAVKVGDEIAKDQILFYLEDAESEELKDKEKEVEAKEDEIDAKQEELDDAILNYTKDILSVDISDPSFHNIQNDNIASVNAYQALIEASRQKVESAQNTVDSLERQMLISSMDSEEDIDRDTKIALATANRDSASKRIGDAEKKIADAKAVITSLGGSTSEDADDSQSSSEQGATSLEVKVVDAEAALSAADEDYMKKKSSFCGALDSSLNYNKGDYFEERKLEGGQIEYSFPKSVDKLTDLQKLADNTGSDDIKDKFKDFKNAYDAYLTASEVNKTAKDNLSNYTTALSTLDSAQQELNNATNEYNSYQKKIDSLTKENAESDGDSEEVQKNLKIAFEDAQKALEKAQEEQKQLLLDIPSELTLSSQGDDIAKIRKELAELKDELSEIEGEYAEIQASLIDATVVAPVEGTIISIEKTAGESTVPQEALATIQVAGKGMSLSFSVTNAQAAKVNVGDKAELQNAWYYNDVMITLNKIKPDPEDPGKKKLLEFIVEGLVQNGESLTLSVGERSAEYEQVVPNSAIREDNKGKFILIIDEKTTPFGNRYKARRVDVEVLASDEINTAVNADLQGYEYVITTSNQPVKAGDQVRLNG